MSDKIDDPNVDNIDMLLTVCKVSKTNHVGSEWNFVWNFWICIDEDSKILYNSPELSELTI